MAASLWGDEFNIEASPSKIKKVKEKIDKPKKTTSSPTDKGTKKEPKIIDIESVLSSIKKEVLRILGRYKENTQVIKTREELTAYIDAAIGNGIIAIDTETNNSLVPLTCKLMGPCIYTPGQKNAYIPLNHVDWRTGERLSWQLTEQDIFEEFERLQGTKIIMHNGKFDYQVIKCTTGNLLKIYWDTMIAVRILDENEKRDGLKEQYIDKIDSSIEKYSIDHLFENVEYAIVDPDIFALYAATDAYMTYKLYEWQLEQFNKSGNERLLDLFFKVEMPVIEVAANMELTGVCIDKEYAARLSSKYHDKLGIVQEKIRAELDLLKDDIQKWRETEEANFHPRSKKPNKDGEYKLLKSKNEQLKDPPELTSPTQFAILLYDILKLPPVDKKSPRGTGEDIITKFKEVPLCSLILEQRGLEKLLGTYIDKIPNCVLPETGRLHAHFHQLGTDTGRFSSTDPNLQNIPSHEKSIRMMFKAGEGNVMVGSDFSQQEPRLLSQFSLDEKMIEAYKQGKDLYATIATGIYHNTYWDNMEKHEDGSPNPEGKKRRGKCKALLLGIMYQMGSKTLAESIGTTREEAQKIIDDFYSGFPKVKEWVSYTLNFVREHGYVEDFWGRRRRLPDVHLPKYRIVNTNNISTGLTFNPILNCSGINRAEKDPLITKYENALKNAKGFRDINIIKKQAEADKIEIHDNTGFIAQAERQCVNARVQGSAASMTKIALRKVYDDEELKKLGFKLLLQIHDELIGECPEENSELVANRLTKVMRESVSDVVTVPFKCDPDIAPCWYYNDYSDILRETYQNMISNGKGKEEAIDDLVISNCECTREQIEAMLN